MDIVSAGLFGLVLLVSIAMWCVLRSTGLFDFVLFSVYYLVGWLVGWLVGCIRRMRLSMVLVLSG